MQRPDVSFWRGRSVLLTGHTGFKGSWLSLWLQSLGAQVHGFALAPPTDPALFEEAGVIDGLASHTIGDVADLEALRAVFAAARPEVVLHLAAQPLVRRSYDDPVETFRTNVMGTVNVLEAARATTSVRAIVNVTTDKCYENREWDWPYREIDPLGGYDPYSSSKACSELVTAAYRNSFAEESGVAIASGRAGNVIGGGDWAADRLVPDCLRAFESGQPVVIRNPLATRPWQHVLEPLYGYLILAENLVSDRESFATAWNFGPHAQDVRPVDWIVDRMVALWGEAQWRLDDAAQPHEAANLSLDTAKAMRRLNWRPRWPLDHALGQIVEWHKAWLAGQPARDLCLRQIEDFTNTVLLPQEPLSR
jgi:CDP-glucose 4,6-dehydratase